MTTVPSDAHYYHQADIWHDCYYYPTLNIYRDIASDNYWYDDHDRWTRVRHLLPHLHLHDHNRVFLRLNTDRPHRYSGDITIETTSSRPCLVSIEIGIGCMNSPGIRVSRDVRMSANPVAQHAMNGRVRRWAQTRPAGARHWATCVGTMYAAHIDTLQTDAMSGPGVIVRRRHGTPILAHR